MMIRYRWFRIQLPESAWEIAAVIAKCPFYATSAYGFAQTSGEDGEDGYRFFWRTRVVVTKLDAEGSPAYEEIDSVSFTNFAVVTLSNMTFLRIENPGRNIRDLLNALETLIGLGFTAKPIMFDKGWPSAVFSFVDSSKLVGLKVVGAVLADDLVARMEFASKEGLVIEKISVLAGLQYKIELAVFELILNGLRGQLAFSANGTVKISGQVAPKLLSLIEQDLPKFV